MVDVCESQVFRSSHPFNSYIGCGRNNSHILKVNKNQTKQGTQKILLFIKSTYYATFFSNVRGPGTIEHLKEATRQEVAAIPPAMTR